MHKHYQHGRRIAKKLLFKTRNLLFDIHEVPVTKPMLDYGLLFKAFVKTRLADFYESLKPFYISRVGTYDSMIYFEQQLPRFWKTIQLLERNRIHPRTVAELGSFYPYATYYFNHKYGSKIVLHDIIHRSSGAILYDVGDIKLLDHNIVTDPIGEYDLYVFSMVIEHLPCNLYAYCSRLVAAMPVGSYLYVSYPTGGKNAKDYDKELNPNSARLFDEHLREFTYRNTSQFFRQLRIVDKERVFVPCAGYSEEILYRKEKP